MDPKFVTCRTRQDVHAVYGFDWAKIVKVEGGYLLFNTLVDYKTWRAQK